ncbi:MAG: phage holin family protein [Kofleriaceae bacterium]
MVGIVDDARELVEAQVSSLKTDLGDRLGDLGTAIKSWLFAVCVAIVTAMLLGLSIAATLTELGIPWFAALWIVTAIAVACVAALVYRARASGRKAADGATDDVKRAVTNSPQLPEGSN